MNRVKTVMGIVLMVFVLSSGLFAATDRTMLLKRWKVVKYIKAGKAVTLTADDYIQMSASGSFEQVLNRYYNKGSWALVEDELTVNNKGEYKWKITTISDSKLSLVRNEEEQMELEALPMPAPVEKTSSANLQHLCRGKWKVNEHQNGTQAIKYTAADFMIFYHDGTYEQVFNGYYTRGNWSFNAAETEIKIQDVTYKLEGLTALILKVSKLPDSKEIMVLAKSW